MFVKKVETFCEKFLCDYFGSDKKEQDDPSSHLRALGLRLICLGNPERTVQSELLHFLRKNDLNAVSECGVTRHRLSKLLPGRLNPDIVVFDKEWNEQCVIELKHRAANQGAIKPLVSNMGNDLKRHKGGPLKNLPIIRIGLYTRIAAIDGALTARD